MKVNLTTVEQSASQTAAINANFDAIEVAFENTLSRNGATPNEMLANLDMNGRSVLNAGLVGANALYLNGKQLFPSTELTGVTPLPFSSFPPANLPLAGTEKMLVEQGSVQKQATIDDIITDTKVNSLITMIPVSKGGTGLSTTPANGQIDIGNGSGFVRTTLSAGANVSIVNGAGTITISSTPAAPDFITQSLGII